jgi:hypothetical protein
MKSIHLKRAKRAFNAVGTSWSDYTKQALVERCRNMYYTLEALVDAMENEMLLFPDQTREQHEAQEFCFADPCTLPEWNKLKAEASTPEGYLPFVYKECDEEQVCIILRDATATDEDCLTTAAWIRMVREFSGYIFALPFKDSVALTSQSMAQIIARTAGVPYHQVRHIEV